MQSIKRRLILLSSSENNNLKATLKLLAQDDGVALDLNAQGLPQTDCSLYLWDSKQKEYNAGKIIKGQLKAKLKLAAVNEIASVAIVHESANSFLLKSESLNWDEIVVQFRLARMNRKDSKTKIEGHKDRCALKRAEECAPELKIVNTVKTERQNDTCDRCAHVARRDKINPFPSLFPKSEWIKISYPGPAGWWHYISGKIFSEGKVAKAIGVPGEYDVTPPIWLEGFGTFLRCNLPDAHGYWLMFQDAQTGEVLDMALSARD